MKLSPEQSPSHVEALMHMINRRGFISAIIASSVSSAFADTPRSAFGPHSTAEEVTMGLDLSGQAPVIRRKGEPSGE